MDIYKQMMKKVFKKLCIHSRKYNLHESFEDWKICEACVLRRIKWRVPHTMHKIDRDICFAIWHEGIL